VTTAVVLRALGLGDTLAGVPALRALRRALPGHRLVLAGPAWAGELLYPDRVVDDVVDVRGLEQPVAGPLHPALAVDLHGRGPQSHRLLSALKPGRLVGFGCPEAGVDGPLWRPGEHERERWCRLVRETWPVTADADDVRLSAPGGSPAPGCVVVHPGAASGSRRWPVSRWSEVARMLSAHARVVVTGGREECRLASTVARRAGMSTGDVLVGQRVGALARLIAEAALVVCGDTGVAHLASAFGTPSVVLYGPTPPTEWGPPPGPHTVLWHAGPRGDPHGPSIDPALRAITLDEVMTAARRRLSRSATGENDGALSHA
jgi:ADP-heptose:LPS heptosyltransferase